MGKIDLKAYNFGNRKPDYRSGDILRKIRVEQEEKEAWNPSGLVTWGMIEATQVTGGYGWAVSDFIKFGYMYTSRPTFTWGLDGTIQLPEGYSWEGSNNYSLNKPAAIQTLINDCISANDWSTYQPAMFMPRIIHWYISQEFYLGCYILVCQLNPECTETDKTIRIHYRFEGKGIPYSDTFAEMVPNSEPEV